jgi:hypothetical protein
MGVRNFRLSTWRTEGAAENLPTANRLKKIPQAYQFDDLLR